MTDISNSLRQWVDANWPGLTLNDFAVKAEFHAQSGQAPVWQALAGDAGFRAYFRLASEPPLLAVYAPPATEKNHAFVQIGGLLRKGGVLTPAIAAADFEQGFFLIEDFGPTLLLDVLKDSNAEALYKEALMALLAIQQCATDPEILEPYSSSLLRTEMELFADWFVPQLLGVEIDSDTRQMLDELFDLLESSALEQPQVVVHRDYHSRNLVFRADGPPGVIDFQDAVIGPITYDLVSLLRDCYVRWPEVKVQAWLQAYLAQARAAGMLKGTDDETFIRWFDWMGLQRHIKVLGIFARLSLRDSKHRYLEDLPLVVHYTLSVARKYEECEAFVEWFETELLPVLKQQPWWRNLAS